MFSNSDARVDSATPHLIREIALISAGLCEASDHKWAKLCGRCKGDCWNV